VNHPQSTTPTEVVHYYVDEAGDPTLFSHKGDIVVGTKGCSNYFMLGKLHVDDPTALAADLEALRHRLLSNAYFAKVPSLQPQEQKTAVAFHAKDDIAEVRWSVFELLLRHKIKFYAVVKDKQQLAVEVFARNKIDPDYRYHPNKLYDSLVQELFSRLHGLPKTTNICFAQRFGNDRTHALKQALEEANRIFAQSFGFMNPTVNHVTNSTPHQIVPLQAVDYMLWALQRFYERKEERYLTTIWPLVGQIIDLDGAVKKLRGPALYGQKAPLTLATRKFTQLGA